MTGFDTDTQDMTITLLASAALSAGLLTALVHLIIVLIVIAIIYYIGVWIGGALSAPPMILKLWLILCAVIALYFVIVFLLTLV